MAKRLAKKTPDFTTFLGVSIAFILVIAAILIGGNPKGFMDEKSILIVVFGTFAVTTSCFSFSEIFQAQFVVLKSIFMRVEDIRQAVLRTLEVAEIARKKGFLELEKYEKMAAHNEFFYDGITMLVDNINHDEIGKIITHEIETMKDRNAKTAAILRKSAEVSPAMGLIGTLIGLVQMLGNLDDPASIGPAMAVALLTTFYGAVMSYMVFSPLASKLERNTKEELLVANIYYTAIMSIAKRENPRKLEMMLNSILPVTKRVNYFDEKHATADNDVQVSQTSSDAKQQSQLNSQRQPNTN